MPPCTPIAVPIVELDSGEARYTYAGASSTGARMLTIGTRPGDLQRGARTPVRSARRF
jgi:hypothetical protein